MASADVGGRGISAAAVFGSYLATGLGLTVLIASDLSRQIEPHYQGLNRFQNARRFPLQRLKIFMMLAGICLSVTWYYMISFFQLSYRTWALEHGILSGPDLILVAAWLKDVQLFRDAWEVALETPGRLFWSQPIFFITAAWSIYVCRTARLRAIPYAWAYMLLGQLVAVSFAMNLFFLAALLYQPSSTPVQNTKPSPFTSWAWNAAVYNIVVIATIVPVALIPASTNGSNFLPVLLIPHLALMLPPVLAILQKGSIRGEMQDRVLARTAYLILFAAAVVLQYRTALNGLGDTSLYKHFHRHLRPEQKNAGAHIELGSNTRGWDSLNYSFRSHPAVSSVGFDVILSTASAFVWFMRK